MRTLAAAALMLSLPSAMAADGSIQVGHDHDGNLVAVSLSAGAASARTPPKQEAAAKGETSVAASPEISRILGELARRHGVSPALVKAVVTVESSFDPKAVSAKGARGLMQLMPGTAADLGVDDLYDPRGNLDGGIRHLRGLLDRFDGDLRLALAAYNAGEEAVRRNGGVPPYPETREYVRRVLEQYERWQRAAPEGPTKTVYRFRDAAGRVVVSNVAGSATRATPSEPRTAERAGAPSAGASR